LRLAMKPASLIQINHLRYPYRLKLKQRLCVNAESSCKKIKRKVKRKAYKKIHKKAYNKHYYYVRSGDSVERIARKLHLKQALIIRRNQLKPPYLLQRGQRLCINRKGDCKHHKRPKKSIYHYHVKAGDTLGRIAIKHAVSLKKLARWNHLSSPYTILVGQQLSFYKRMGKKPNGDKIPPPGTVFLPNLEYTVRRYETLDYLSNRFGISEKRIIALNHLKKPYKLKKGQLLCLNNPAPCKSTVHIVAQQETLELIAQRYSLGINKLRQLNLLSPPYKVFPSQRICLLKPYPCIGAVRVNKLDKHWMPRLEWPLSNDHRIVTPFGRHGGRMHDGIDIQAIKGTPVYAAADGKVIFAGEKLGEANPKKKALKSAYGKMIVIEHPNHIFTIYAHNNTIYARRNRQVKQGDTIALSGDTGRVDMPQLHFELRKGKKAINPLDYLPQRTVIIDYEK
ncbi:MAG: LysM peptidoglycan-binding domain-containing protein, partial [Mariprofundaceae bacterium]|nr:LysM peptidoglycan-binding domain-containing protein [Mariprofundaceae bacterium]